MITFNLENKITWEELSPSLQELFKALQTQIVDLPDVIEKQIERDLTDPSSSFYKSFQSFTKTVVTNEINNPNSTIYKALINATTTIINNSTNDPSSGIYQSLQNYINSQISNQLNNQNSSIYNSMTSYMNKYLDQYFAGGTDGTTNGTGYKRIKQLMFTNLPPKIGFLDETTANISGAFNMSTVPMYNRAWWITSDIEGREMYYFRAYNEVGSTVKIFRCYRSSLTDMSSFIFDNDPVCPIGLGEDYYMDDIIGITNSYIIAHCTNGSRARWYKISTKYSSNVKNWTNYVDITNLVNKIGGSVNTILYFDKYKGTTINRYLILDIKSDSTACLIIADSSFNILSTQDIFNPMNPAPHTSYDNGHAVINNGYYSYISMAYIEDEDSLVNRLLVWMPLLGSIVKDDGSMYYSAIWSNGYVDWLDFKPTQLLSTSNFFNQESRWHMGRTLYSNMDKSNVFGGDGTFSISEAWCNGSIFYDSLNKFLYTSRNHRDELNNHVTRVPFKNLDWSCKGAGILYNSANADFRLNPPDTSPWAKKHYDPSVIYNGVYLKTESVSCGMNLKNFNSTQIMHTAIIPKSFSSGKVGVTAGSWTVRYYGTWPSGKRKPATVIDDTDSNASWSAAESGYSETKENFNSADKCSWYTLGMDNSYIYVYRLYHTTRKDRNNITRDDVLQIDYNNPVCKFIRPSGLYYEWMPQGCSWAYKSSSFGGTDQLIIYAWLGGQQCHLSSGNWVEDNPDYIPYWIVLNKDGSYVKLRNNDSSYRNIWFGRTSSNHQIMRYAYLCSHGFLDDDGRTFYCNCHYGTNNFNDWGHLSYKVIFNKDNSGNIVSINNINEVSHGCGGQWNGRCSWGYSKVIGYFRTYANFSGISYITFDRNSLDNAISEGTTLYLTNTGSTGLVANLQTTPIYIGGYYSLIPAQEIILSPNSHNYIYLFRNPSDPDDVIVEVYDKLLGGDDKDIHFARILVADIETDSEGPIRQTSYKTVNYGSGVGLS